MRNDSSDAPRAGPSTLEVSFTFQSRNGQRNGREGPDNDQVVEPGNVPRVSKIMALAIRFDGLVRPGEIRDYTDLARLGYVTPARMTQLMCLLHLAPDIQEELLFLPRTLEGRDPIREKDLRPIAAVPHWNRQRGMWKKMVSRRS